LTSSQVTRLERSYAEPPGSVGLLELWSLFAPNDSSAVETSASRLAILLGGEDFLPGRVGRILRQQVGELGLSPDFGTPTPRPAIRGG